MVDGRFVSYAQNLEDVMLWRALGDVVPQEGFYIDLGASDPDFLNVTRAFYQRGWRGLNVDPLPEIAAALRAARPLDTVVQAAVSDNAGSVPFYRVVVQGNSGLSTFDAALAERVRAIADTIEQVSVPVITLAELCRTHVRGPIHFLKIDVEGAEAAVLAGADFQQYRPWIVLLEATAPNSQVPTHASWEPILLAAGYRFVWFDGLNRFYVAEEQHERLQSRFLVQPNVFDAYIQHEPRLLAETQALAQLAERRRLRISELEAELQRAGIPLPATPPDQPAAGK